MGARFPIWLGNRFDLAYQNAAIGGDDSQLPFSEAWVKVADGPVWQGQYDPSAHAPHDVQGFGELVRVYRDQGIGCKPWMVVNGVNMDGSSCAREEAELAIDAARMADGVIIVDLEPEEGRNYWRRSRGANADRAREFLDACRAAGVWVWVAPDARSGRLEPCDFGTWAGHPATTLILPQVYWTAFGRPYDEAIDTALAALAVYGVAPNRVGMVLPGDIESGLDFAAALELCHARGTLPVSMFQRANLTAAVVGTLQGMHSPWRDRFPETDTDGPTPPPPGVDIDAAVAALGTASAALASARAALGR